MEHLHCMNFIIYKARTYSNIFSYDILKTDMQIVTLVCKVSFVTCCNVGDIERGVEVL